MTGMRIAERNGEEKASPKFESDSIPCWTLWNLGQTLEHLDDRTRRLNRH